MELWIRSQDRTFLTKVDTIGIVEGRDFWSIDESLTVSFGKYKTKERALEVLDEIQDILSVYDRYIKKPADMYKNIFEPSTIVYEMPKE